ncbi:CppA N-terminal domain-containing protein [Streptococcus catagoni]|uniref:CppA N-terminal domain-containing protein n=1 Tax=Streptococcus catagoni TaxID=2654874 RepID=UPI001407B79E|nr:CppA N-terminal domain-containing protein [Streptococcus catagoni]
MTLLKGTIFNTPVLRVNNRQVNIDFYQKSLGMKLVYEENAIAVFTSFGDGKERFVIEETPSARARAVEGAKKLNTIVIKSKEPKAIEQLIAHGAEVERLFKGKNGYAYETFSPEGDRFLLHAEDDVNFLEAAELPQLEADKDFRGLPDFTFEKIVLNVLDEQKSRNFYEALFESSFPIEMDFTQASGPDLAIAPNLTWDLEILEFSVPKECDLKQVKAQWEAKGLDLYLDKKENILVLSDPSQVEVWLMK